MPRFASTLFALLVAVASAGHHSEWIAVSKSFKDCCGSKSDVDVNRLLVATRDYCNLLARFGRFVGPSVANVRGCIDKVEKARNELRGTTKEKLDSVKALLKSERHIHRPGGVLVDPSAAMGMLWLRRGLEFWIEVFDQQIQALKKKKTVALASQCEVAYRRTVADFHGWASRRGSKVALSLAPEWTEVCARAKLGGSDEALRKDLCALVSATRELCDRLKSLQVKYDLEDKRRSL